MKLTEVSTNSQDIFPFVALLGEGGGYPAVPVYSLLIGVRRREVNWIAFLGNPALPLHTCMHPHLPPCVCFMFLCLCWSFCGCNIECLCVCVCPSGLLQLTGESHWEVYEEVSVILRQICCYCSQRDSPGSWLSVKVLEVRFQPVC